MVASNEMTMTDGQRLLRRIQECPEDDAIRLIYSDWLEEQEEEERARFIREAIANPSYEFVSLAIKPKINPLIIAGINKVGGEWAWGSNDECSVLIDLSTGIRYRTERGFVCSVRLTCEAFVGGQCDNPNCEGTGIDSAYEPYYCEKCKGTGRIEGVAGELFSRHPITEVRLVDKKPNPPGRAIGWIDFGDDLDVIPGEIFDLINGDSSRGEYIWKRFESESDANAALSRACVAYGRQLAGLEPLPAEQSGHDRRTNNAGH